MAAEYLTWPQAVETVCDQLERFAVCRDAGFDVQQAATAIGISAETGVRLEQALQVLLAALKNETAPDATEAAQRDEWRSS